MKKHYLTFILMGLLYSTSFADTTIYSTTVTQIDFGFNDDDLKNRWDKALGSFQFEILKNREGTRNLQINIEIIDEIEANRHETEIRYLEYTPYIRIKILPKSIISGSYEKLELMKDGESFE